MQLSERQFCADWVARMGELTPLTTATVLQYLNLRAQADARPVAWSANWIRDQIADQIDMWPLATMTVWQIADHVRKIAITAPEAEASAPGLSEPEIIDLWNRSVGEVSGLQSRAITFARAIRARASAATVAEPSGGTPDTYPARLLHESDKSLAWRVDSWHKRHPQAAQQQAKPPKQTSDAGAKPTEQQAEHVGIAPEHVGIQQAEPSDSTCAKCGFDNSDPCPECSMPAAQQQAEPGADEAVTHRMNVGRTVYAIHAQKQEPQPERRDWFNAGFKAGFADRAAQSGQRAGMAEGWKVMPENPTMEMRRAGNERLEKLASSETPSLADRAFYVYKAMLDAAPTRQQEGGDA